MTIKNIRKHRQQRMTAYVPWKHHCIVKPKFSLYQVWTEWIKIFLHMYVINMNLWIFYSFCLIQTRWKRLIYQLMLPIPLNSRHCYPASFAVMLVVLEVVEGESLIPQLVENSQRVEDFVIVPPNALELFFLTLPHWKYADRCLKARFVKNPLMEEEMFQDLREAW